MVITSPIMNKGRSTYVFKGSILTFVNDRIEDCEYNERTLKEHVLLLIEEQVEYAKFQQFQKLRDIIRNLDTATYYLNDIYKQRQILRDTNVDQRVICHICLFNNPYTFKKK